MTSSRNFKKETNPKMCMEPQKACNSKSHLKQKTKQKANFKYIT